MHPLSIPKQLEESTPGRAKTPKIDDRKVGLYFLNTTPLCDRRFVGSFRASWSGFFKLFRYTLLSALPAVASLPPLCETPAIVNAPRIMAYAEKSLPHQGRLMKTDNCFLYLKVSNDYIIEALNELGKQRKVEAPAFFGQGAVGAHITVIEANEIQGRKMKLPPSGTVFSFKITGFVSVDVANEHGSKRIYMYLIDAPELAQIRTDNGLPPKVRGHDFHITAAIEYIPKQHEESVLGRVGFTPKF
jgi:hypothetical protein